MVGLRPHQKIEEHACISPALMRRCNCERLCQCERPVRHPARQIWIGYVPLFLVERCTRPILPNLRWFRHVTTSFAASVTLFLLPLRTPISGSLPWLMTYRYQLPLLSPSGASVLHTSIILKGSFFQLEVFADVDFESLIFFILE